jgi:hypothetical protein
MNGLMTSQLQSELRNQRGERLQKSFRARRLGRFFGRKVQANTNVVGATDGSVLHFRPPARASGNDEHASARVA